MVPIYVSPLYQGFYLSPSFLKVILHTSQLHFGLDKIFNSDARTRSLILKDKDDNSFKGKPSQVLDINTGAKFEGPKVGAGQVSDEAPFGMANHRGGVLTTLRCYSVHCTKPLIGVWMPLKCVTLSPFSVFPMLLLDVIFHLSHRQ